MQFEYRDPAEIQPNPWNSNVVSHENEEKLRASIERNGMFKPVLVREMPDGSLQSIGGWHRAEQALELGMDQIPVCNLGKISDDQAKEISLADNARYGLDDTLKLTEILGSLNLQDIESIMPWTSADINAMTASIAVNIDDLDIDEPVIPDDDDEPSEAPAPKTVKTHGLLRFRVSLANQARLSTLITQTMKTHGFTKEDDLTNAGDALAYLLLSDTDHG